MKRKKKKNKHDNFEDTKGIIRIRKSKKNRQYNDQQKKDKMTNNDNRYTKHYTENQISINTNPTNNKG